MNWLFLYWSWYRSRSAVLALGPYGPLANTDDLEPIPGPIQKQPASNTIVNNQYMYLYLP